MVKGNGRAPAGRAGAPLAGLPSVDAPAVTDGGADPLPARNGTDGGSLALGMALLADLLGGTRPTAAADRAPDLLACLLYTSPSPRDPTRSRMPSSA